MLSIKKATLSFLYHFFKTLRPIYTYRIQIIFLLSIVILYACQEDNTPVQPKLFSELKDSGISFNNKLDYTAALNPYTYRNFYNGAGVAVGDINNDGLDDIYFTGNLVDNQLYINQGDLTFKNITESAGVACPDIWSSGVVFVDINADNYLDIYVCKAGPPGGENRHNELFINNGDLTFTEASKAYGLDIIGLGIQSAFFDYDRDGDLDCYLLNNSIKPIGGFDLIKDKRNEHSDAGNKLLRNDKGKFTDVTSSSGIYSSEIGFGLGITISDFNTDGWPDVYISNDYFEKDYLYINQKNGTFTEAGEDHFQCFSLGSMGADAADLNNDLLPDLMVTEMFPSTTARKKTKAVYDGWKKYNQSVKAGYYHQVPRNTLQVNTESGQFLEISRYANVDGTDWSWSCLMQDYNNDGYKDIFISNGVYKDLLDRDYLDFAGNDASQLIAKYKEEGVRQLIDSMKSEAIPNCMFSHKGDFNFNNLSDEWGLGTPSFSNGSAYSDLDNDGDLDLIINNVNQDASIYINSEQELNQNNYISFSLKGTGENSYAVGSKITIYACGQSYMNELYPSRGFQSSVSYKLHFGLGNCTVIDSGFVQHPDGNIEPLINPKVNSLNTFSQSEKVQHRRSIPKAMPLSKVGTLDFKHNEQYFNQFNREPLSYKMNTQQGPIIESADIDNDGDLDIFVGGAKNQSSVLFVNNNGTYTPYDSFFQDQKKAEVTDAIFVDSDKDGDLDLFVANGGTAFSQYANELKDVLYLNDGTGQFSLAKNALINITAEASSTINTLDINGDQYPDIIIGINNSNLKNNQTGSVYVFINNKDNTFSLSPHEDLIDIGIITDSAIMDINKDGNEDLIITGEWMKTTVVINNSAKLEVSTDDYVFNQHKGMWNNILIDDFNNDGQDDLLIGNIGNNSTITPSHRIYTGDYDNNGAQEQILCEVINGEVYPIVDFDLLRSQVPSIKKKVIYHRDYAQSTMQDLFGSDILQKSDVLTLDETKTSLYLSTESGYQRMTLPQEIQYSSIHTAAVMDVNKDGYKDILLGGNHFLVLPQYGREDASTGWLLTTSNIDNNYSIKEIEPLSITGEMRDIEPISQDEVMFGINDEIIKIYRTGNK